MKKKICWAVLKLEFLVVLSMYCPFILWINYVWSKLLSFHLSYWSEFTEIATHCLSLLYSQPLHWDISWIQKPMVNLVQTRELLVSLSKDFLSLSICYFPCFGTSFRMTPFIWNVCVWLIYVRFLGFTGEKAQ